MQLTTQQEAILRTNEDLKINAIAGSGKTATLIAYAASRPAQASILYIAFNKSVKLEAQKRFADQRLYNVQVETAHALAYAFVVRPNAYTINSKGYAPYELVELLDIKPIGEKHSEYIIANHISRFAAYFCNSDARKVQELNYLDIVSDTKARLFVKNIYDHIEYQTRVFLAKMDSGALDITHDFYLKKFQLLAPQLHYDYILFDEGQDASPVMLDIVLRQNAIKVFVGDMHQQIYGWRHAINALEKMNFPIHFLSNSFRFGAEIASLAAKILQWKKHLGIAVHEKVNGLGKAKSEANYSKAILARTNLGLLLKAIEYVTEDRRNTKIYFEGNFNSYTYADDGASLYDVLALHNKDKQRIRNKVVQQMKDLKELEDYIDKTEDVQLGMMLKVVQEYGNEIHDILRSIKQRNITGDDKSQAGMIFSTVHRCKGMEYDEVELASDFIYEDALLEIAKNPDSGFDKDKTIEEINLLYVAVTRARQKLKIPEQLLPIDFPVKSNAYIEVLTKAKDATFDKAKSYTTLAKKPKPILKPKATSQKENRWKDAGQSAYAPWTADLDEELQGCFESGESIEDMAIYFGRTKGAIISRIKKLGYWE